MANITIKEYIIDYARDKYYFHINDLKRYFTEKGIKFEENTLKRYLYLFKKNELIYTAGRGWYSNVKKIFELDTKSVEKLIRLIKDNLPLLEFSCWSTEQLKGFFQHLPTQFVTFIYTDKDFLQSVKDFLIENVYNVYLNPYKIEAEKFIELKTQTIILRPSMSSRIPKEKNWAKIEKILVDLFMEKKKIGFIDEEEYKRIFSNVIISYRINIAEMLDYSHHRKIKDEIQNIIIKIIKSTKATFY